MRNFISKIEAKPEGKSETYCFLRSENWDDSGPLDWRILRIEP